MPMDWDKLRIFHTVAEAGSFTHAGDKLHLSQSAVSRQISALESSVKTPLFHRHARGLILTEQGETLLRTVKEVYYKLGMAQARLAESKDHPTGPLKVTTTVAFGSLWLTPHIKEFIDLYPEVELSLLLSDHEIDLGMREADVAIRMAPPRQPDLIQRPLVSFKSQIYGAHEYLAERGTPMKPQDLDEHNLIVFGDDTPQPVSTINWILHEGENEDHPRKPVFQVNNQYGVYRAVRSGLGLAALSEFMIPEKSNLEHILPELEGPSTQAYFVYPEELRHSKRITVFRDFLLHKVAEAAF